MLKLYHQEVPRKPDGQTLDRLTRPSINVDDIQLSDGTKHYKTKTVSLFASTKVRVEINLEKLDVQFSSPKCRRVTTVIKLINRLNLRQISNAEGH